MQSKLARYFTDSAVGLLAIFTTALVVCNIVGAKLVQPHDPLFAVSMNVFFWILGAIAMAVMLVCIYVRQPRLQLALILWFAVNLIVYRLGLHWQGVPDIHGYIGTLANTFNLSNHIAAGLLNFLFLYLFTISAALLSWNLLAKPEEVPLKAICAHCGGHIGFSALNLGQKVPCPHCQIITTLHKPDLLKMACFFCQEHIEFPSHAIGEKIPCPHCKMGITLKEPAAA